MSGEVPVYLLEGASAEERAGVVTLHGLGDEDGLIKVSLIERVIADRGITRVNHAGVPCVRRVVPYGVLRGREGGGDESEETKP